MADTPHFEDLSRMRCVEVLRRNSVGRIAYANDQTVDIEPVHYVLDEVDGLAICIRTSEGSKAVLLERNQWAAFEVDEIDGPLDWRSVVARGSVYRVGAGDPAVDEPVMARAIDGFRRLDPGAFRADDPLGFRDIVLRLHVDSLTGRRAGSPGSEG